MAQAAADGMDVSAVVTRGGTPTALLLDLVEDGGRRRLAEVIARERGCREAGLSSGRG